MNFLDWTQILRMGCICGKETLTINNRRFFLRSRLGEGGFSVVDLVEDARTKRLYALKRITCHGTEDEKVAEREIQVMKSLKHPGIIQLEECATITVGRHVQSNDAITEVLIVMPFYKRGSLQDRLDVLLKKRETMDEKTIWSLFLGICRAVKVMHSHDPPYAHRDLKPGNIMINDEGSPVLMDLGSTTKATVDVNNRSQTQALVDEAAERSSMLYRPPELFNVQPGDLIDQRTDIWSLGCLLYSMAYRDSPFEPVYQRGDSMALAALARNITFPNLPGFSRSLEQVVTECMVVNLVDRPDINTTIHRVETICKSQNISS